MSVAVQIIRVCSASAAETGMCDATEITQHCFCSCKPPELSLYKLNLGGSAGCKAVLPVGVRLRRRCVPAPDASPAEDGDRGDLDGLGVVYDVEGWSWSSFFLNSRGVKYEVSLELCM